MSPILIALLAVVGFSAYMAVLFWAIAFFAGWTRLAQTYVAYHQPQGETYGWRTLRTGPLAHYDNSINATLSSEGIYLVPLAAFRIGHAPLLLPWSLVTGVEPARFPRTGIQVTIEPEGKRLQLYLPDRARATVERYASRAMPRPARPIVDQELPDLTMGNGPG